MSFTVLQDADIRMHHYLESLRFYLENTNVPILFVENSGTDISHLFQNEIRKGRLEILTFQGNDYEKTLGKGYGEMVILEHATLFSKFFKQADFIFKITGRYKVLNIESYINRYYDIQHSFDLVMNFTNSLSFVDSRFWGANVLFFNDILLKFKDEINDEKSIYFEHVLCKSAHQAIIKGYKYSSLYHRPRYSGVYGTLGITYNDSYWKWKAKDFIEKTLNIVQNHFQK
jgi:hypothetical protein